jgi:hypothetical protein
MTAYRYTPLGLSNNGVNERVWGYLATGDYFEVLGVKPALGRFFTPEDDRAPGAHPVAVIAYESWQKRFAGDSQVIGKRRVHPGESRPAHLFRARPPETRRYDVASRSRVENHSRPIGARISQRE